MKRVRIERKLEGKTLNALGKVIEKRYTYYVYICNLFGFHKRYVYISSNDNQMVGVKHSYQEYKDKRLAIHFSSKEEALWLQQRIKKFPNEFLINKRS